MAEQAGFGRDEIAYVDLACQDLGDVAVIDRLYASLFTEGRRPARTVYQAARLPFDGKVKVQAIAARAS